MLDRPVAADSDLERRAGERANAVRAFLSHQQIEPDRLFIVAPKFDAAATAENAKTTRG